MSPYRSPRFSLLPLPFLYLYQFSNVKDSFRSPQQCFYPLPNVKHEKRYGCPLFICILLASHNQHGPTVSEPCIKQDRTIRSDVSAAIHTIILDTVTFLPSNKNSQLQFGFRYEPGSVWIPVLYAKVSTSVLEEMMYSNNRHYVSPNSFLCGRWHPANEQQGLICKNVLPERSYTKFIRFTWIGYAFTQVLFKKVI